MKKLFCILLAALTLSGCSTVRPLPEPEHEAFEDVAFGRVESVHPSASSEQELFDMSDVVVIGSTSPTYTEGKRVYYDKDGKPLTDTTGGIASCAVIRDLTVDESLKGDLGKGDVVRFATGGTSGNTETGAINGWLYKGDVITKQNVRYIFYLVKAPDGSYKVAADGAVVCVDGKDPACVSVHDAAVREKYSKIIRKYAEVDK